MEGLNAWAVLVAAIVSFALGALWYSPALFLKTWAREARMEKPGGSPVTYAVLFVLGLVAAGAFSWLIGPRPALGIALSKGLLVGICFVATSFYVNYSVAHRGMILWAVDAGYHVTRFVLFGLILGLWH
jgi:Protein of unknown function (DUF1761)